PSTKVKLGWEGDFPEEYEVLDCCGKGSFGSCWTARERTKDKNRGAEEERVVVLKRINRTCSPGRILNEYQHLCRLGGQHNVVSVEELIKTPGGCFSLVMPYFEHDDFVEYMTTLSCSGIALYMRSLLEALKHVHSNGVIHRDVKPSNFMYSVSRSSGLLIDFGLAEAEDKWQPRVEALGRFREKSTTRPLRSCHTDGLSNVEVERMNRRGNPSPIRRTGKGRARGRSERDNRGYDELLNKAERGGTMGFRAPEVLWHSRDQ
ncbi:unnamed protein product, partial [Choristocarpus tenellus]